MKIDAKVVLRFVIFSTALLIGTYIVWFFNQLPPTVEPSVETTPVPHTSDAAADPCIWIHPDDPSKSVIIGADKDGGIGIYELNGKQLHYLEFGRITNIDLRYNFPIADELVTLVVASNRSRQALEIYRLQVDTRTLEKVGSIAVDIELYGCCLYFSRKEQAYFCFATSATGYINQYQLSSNTIGEVSGTLVRKLQVNSKCQGCVADDELAFLYVSEEKKGVWKFYADPGIKDNSRELVYPAETFGKLCPNVKGLTLYYMTGGKGYLIVSSEGNNRFVAFRREGSNDYVGSFAIESSSIDKDNFIDEVTHSDGIDVCNVPMGKGFSKGLFVAKDDYNGKGENQNFKLVPWDRIAGVLEGQKSVDASFDPRRIGKKSD